ncbi:amidase domain-containing protein [Paenibacillus sp. 19GGS1-52]|uniref:amidase domain-containing protein n=1 Tax=Paenibacillus sp. 19GGS1-52 TaxID=2758563 RepID=UPI001EFABF72|nr:amidase domain-containing protein [Paenibacillus sp. 19GGS1-52]ULO10042.1 amidase domain-containing protein [Paenibacillus sp. 19GGS1-52]
MRKIVSTMLVFLFMSSSVALASPTDFSTSQDTVEIQGVIQKYFNSLAESIKIKDPSKLDELNQLINLDSQEGSQLLSYETDKTNYLIEEQNNAGTEVKNFTNAFEFNSVNVNSDEAQVEVTLVESIDYNFLDESSVTRVQHSISLAKNNDEWLITEDNYSDEFKKLYDYGTDFSDLTTTQDQSKTTTTNELNESIGVLSIPGDYFDSYDSTKRANAVSYARSHTDSSGTTSTAYYNTSQFKTYGDTDCQNFVSQSVWYGLGGRVSSTKAYPMNSYWWANLTGEATTWYWTGTSYFYNWVTSNYTNNSYGLQGTASSLPTNIQVGDYVYVPGHVLLVTKIVDNDANGVVNYGDLYISAHTNNQLDKNLKALYGGTSAPSNMQFVHITGNKWNTGQ